MKTTIGIAACMALTLFMTACKQGTQKQAISDKTSHAPTAGKKIKAFPAPQPPYSTAIPADSANRMISSYLQSIDDTHNDSDLRSLIFNVDSLAGYVFTAQTHKIKNIKLMFAHSLEYINAGNYGKYAGYRSGALTLVLAGYDSSGDYILMPGNRVLEHSMPCPTNCPLAGTASGSLLPTAMN